MITSDGEQSPPMDSLDGRWTSPKLDSTSTSLNNWKVFRYEHCYWYGMEGSHGSRCRQQCPSMKTLNQINTARALKASVSVNVFIEQLLTTVLSEELKSSNGTKLVRPAEYVGCQIKALSK